MELAKRTSPLLVELSTIQKTNKLNTVIRINEKGPGGGYHEYTIRINKPNGYASAQRIVFQKGPRNDPEAVHGALDEDLLEIVRDRLAAFQGGDYACRENAIALTHVEEALLWLNKRKEDRAERGVLGTMNK